MGARGLDASRTILNYEDYSVVVLADTQRIACTPSLVVVLGDTQPATLLRRASGVVVFPDARPTTFL